MLPKDIFLQIYIYIYVSFKRSAKRIYLALLLWHSRYQTKYLTRQWDIKDEYFYTLMLFQWMETDQVSHLSRKQVSLNDCFDELGVKMLQIMAFLIERNHFCSIIVSIYKFYYSFVFNMERVTDCVKDKVTHNFYYNYLKQKSYRITNWKYI